MELTTRSIEKIKTLQEKKKVYAHLMELTTKSMKNKIKQNKKNWCICIMERSM